MQNQNGFRAIAPLPRPDRLPFSPTTATPQSPLSSSHATTNGAQTCLPEQGSLRNMHSYTGSRTMYPPTAGGPSPLPLHQLASPYYVSPYHPVTQGAHGYFTMQPAHLPQITQPATPSSQYSSLVGPVRPAVQGFNANLLPNFTYGGSPPGPPKTPQPAQDYWQWGCPPALSSQLFPSPTTDQRQPLNELQPAQYCNSADHCMT